MVLSQAQRLKIEQSFKSTQQIEETAKNTHFLPSTVAEVLDLPLNKKTYGFDEDFPFFNPTEALQNWNSLLALQETEYEDVVKKWEDMIL